MLKIHWNKYIFTYIKIENSYLIFFFTIFLGTVFLIKCCKCSFRDKLYWKTKLHFKGQSWKLWSAVLTKGMVNNVRECGNRMWKHDRWWGSAMENVNVFDSCSSGVTMTSAACFANTVWQSWSLFNWDEPVERWLTLTSLSAGLPLCYSVGTPTLRRDQPSLH